MLKKQFVAVDLFCGVGGLTHGLINSGIPVIAGLDIDRTCEYSYEKNNNSKIYCADITTTTGKLISDLLMVS